MGPLPVGLMTTTSTVRMKPTLNKQRQRNSDSWCLALYWPKSWDRARSPGWQRGSICRETSVNRPPTHSKFIPENVEFLFVAHYTLESGTSFQNSSPKSSGLNICTHTRSSVDSNSDSETYHHVFFHAPAVPLFWILTHKSMKVIQLM